MRALLLGALVFLGTLYAVLPAKETKVPAPCQGPTVLRPDSEGRFPSACALPQWT